MYFFPFSHRYRKVQVTQHPNVLGSRALIPVRCPCTFRLSLSDFQVSNPGLIFQAHADVFLPCFVPSLFLGSPCDLQVSNRLLCFRNSLLLAALLNRTLLVPMRAAEQFEFVYDLRIVFHLDTVRGCFGNDTVMSTEEYYNKYQKPAAVDRLQCWHGPNTSCLATPQKRDKDCPATIDPALALNASLPDDPAQVGVPTSPLVLDPSSHLAKLFAGGAPAGGPGAPPAAKEGEVGGSSGSGGAASTARRRLLGEGVPGQLDRFGEFGEIGESKFKGRTPGRRLLAGGFWGSAKGPDSGTASSGAGLAGVPVQGSCLGPTQEAKKVVEVFSKFPDRILSVGDMVDR